MEYQDDFFTDLIKNDFSDEDKLNTCKIIEKYLSSFLKGLDSGYSYVLNAPLDQVRKYILLPKLFFQIISKDMIFVINEQKLGWIEDMKYFQKMKSLLKKYF